VDKVEVTAFNHLVGGRRHHLVDASHLECAGWPNVVYGLTKCGLDERTRSEDFLDLATVDGRPTRPNPPSCNGLRVVSTNSCLVGFHLQVEPPPLDPDQLDIRQAKLESLRDDTQELGDGNNEKGS